ncbi:MAG: tyrosine-type recombinase/integrase [Bacillota bacterium]
MARRLSPGEKLEAIRPLTEGFPQEVWEFFQDRAPLYTLATLRNYAYDLRIFLDWLRSRRGSDGPIDWNREVTFRTVREFFLYLRDYESRDRQGRPVRRSNDVKGLARKLATLSSLFEYLVVMEHMAENPIGSRERRRQLLGRLRAGGSAKELPVYLTRDEAARLIRTVHTLPIRDHGASRARDQALLALLLFTGLRASEVVSLNKESIEYESTGDPTQPLRAVIRVTGKGEKTRIVPLHPAVERLIRQYLETRPESEAPEEHRRALFWNRDKRRITANGVWRVVRKYAAAAGLTYKEKAISPHKLRHSFATMLLSEGQVSLRELQELLGHASINTTMIYTHISDAGRRRAIEEHPLGALMENEGPPAAAGPAAGPGGGRPGRPQGGPGEK